MSWLTVIRRLAPVIGVAGMCMCCLPGAHYELPLKGQLRSETGTPIPGCTLSVLSVSGRTLLSVPVSATFDETLPVAPTTEEYIVVINCEGFAGGFRSEPVLVRRSMEEPHDFGTIVIRR